MGLSSCSSMTKAYLGIRNFKVFVDQQERTAYYEGLINDVDYSSSVSVFKHTTNLISAFNDISEYKLLTLLLIERTTDSYRSLDCYEDMGCLVEKMNGNDFTATKVAEPKFINLVEKYKSTETIIIELSEVPTGEKNFEVYFISGVFFRK